MNPRRMFQPLLIAVAAAAALSLSSCAHAPVPPGTMVSAPQGTVLTYLRKSTGSFGNLEGNVVWTMTERQWQGRTVVAAVSPQAGTTLHDPASHAILGALNGAGQLVVSYDPPVGYAWPLVVGKTWTTRHQVTTPPNGRTVVVEIKFEVRAHEDVVVPAGTFDSYRVVSTDSFGEVQQVWTSPQLGLSTVKRILDRPATHPLGAGHLEGVLIARTLPR